MEKIWILPPIYKFRREKENFKRRDKPPFLLLWEYQSGQMGMKSIKMVYQAKDHMA